MCLTLLQALELETQNFKQLNDKLRKSLADHSEAVRQFQIEQVRLHPFPHLTPRNVQRKFDSLKNESMAAFEHYKVDEEKKLKKERRVQERNSFATQMLPTRKFPATSFISMSFRERQEIELLKAENQELVESLRTKDVKFSLQHDRYQKRIDELQQKNSQLQHELNATEKSRIATVVSLAQPAQKRVILWGLWFHSRRITNPHSTSPTL